ncbi:MAG: hypothetical protein ACMG5Z_02900 [Luteimonas sp.]
MTRSVLLLCCLATVFLAGCMPDVRKEVERDIAQAQWELVHEPLELSADGLPTARLHPSGDLEIGGRKLPLDGMQREALLDYRQQVVRLGEAGLAIGSEGGALAARSMRRMLFAVLTGTTARAERHIDAEAARIEAKAHALCPELESLQQAHLHAAGLVPELKPYGDISQKDLEDCRQSGAHATHAAAT